MHMLLIIIMLQHFRWVHTKMTCTFKDYQAFYSTQLSQKELYKYSDCTVSIL